MLQRLSTLIRVASVVAAGIVVCFAQAERGGISGAVTDTSGAAMGRVRISARNLGTGAVARVETTDDGYYKIPYLPAG